MSGWCLIALTWTAAAADTTPSYLPADSQVVVFINIRQILDAPLTKKYALEQARSTLKANAEAQQIFAAAGLDPLRDVHNLTLASPGGTAADRVMVIARGAFDLERIHSASEQFAKAHPEQLVIRTEDGQRIYEGKTPQTSMPAFVAFPDKTTLLLSPSKSYLLETMKQKQPVKKELQALLDQTETGASVWLVALATDELRKALATNPQTAPIADKLLAFTGTIRVRQNVEAAIHIFTKDPKSAENVERLLDGLKSIAAFAAQNSQPYGDLVKEVVDAFKISSEKSTVTLSVTISENLIEKGIKTKK